MLNILPRKVLYPKKSVAASHCIRKIFQVALEQTHYVVLRGLCDTLPTKNY
jgi:hypothetical protein